MTPGLQLFKHVQENFPGTWLEMQAVIRPHKISSIIKIFNKHLDHVEDLEIFNMYYENIPLFLLEFCKTASRNFLQPGDPYGLLLTCRCTKVFTQDTLDKRHLRDEVPPLSGCPLEIEKKLRFEINIYTSINQIYEISNKRKFTTIFVRNCTVPQLLALSKDESCYLAKGNNKAATFENVNVYISLKRFIIVDSFIPNVLKIIVQKSDDKEYVFRHVENLENIIGFTDLKFVFKKCGIVCYYFNTIKIVKLQFFKTLHPHGRNVKDIFNILMYQIYTGVPLPLNRTGLRQNLNRSGLEKLSFEAVKQNYVLESCKSIMYKVEDSTSKVFFGIQYNEGTGYKFELLNKV